jgi:hypothetical protein
MTLTPADWDVHWYRIREQLREAGLQPVEACAMADTQCAEQFGTRPEETT